MSDHPKISIISTVYNTGPYLRPAVESILAQTFTDFELLLVDDGSHDGSAASATRWHRRMPASGCSTSRTAARPTPATPDWTTPAATTSAWSIPMI